jgi:hypothetical protein
MRAGDEELEVMGEGISIEQESEALNQGLELSLQILDDVIVGAHSVKGC